MSDIVEYDVTTGEVIKREYTQEELEYRSFLEQQLADLLSQIQQNNGE